MRTSLLGRVLSAALPLLLLAAACSSADDGGWDPSAFAARTSEPPVETPPPRDPRTRRPLAEAVRYEQFCPRRDPLPRRLVATSDGTRVAVVSEAGTRVARVPGGAPVRWSASGRLLAVGPRGELWTWDGKRYEGPDVPLELASQGGARWAWSPTGDCAVVLANGRLDAFHTGAGANVVTLVPRGVEAAAWGRGPRIAVLLREESRRSLWIADLRESVMRRVTAFPPDVCCVVLGGWAPGGDEILFWAGPGTSVMQDGWPLQSVDAEGRRRTWGRTLPRPDTITRCGNAVAALTGDRTLQRARVALLRPGRPVATVAEPDRFTGVSCSANGSFVAATGTSGLRILFADGSMSTAIGPAVPSAAPEWGPPGSGVLFFRRSGRATQLWFVPEGGTAPRALIELPRTPERPPHQTFDWTGSPPTGLLWGSY
ncbi:MAG TPA: hypothetical protein VHI71_02690 [Actinomycetota bacterium]|nr:hypothetical protein [Actinomycetota bacterium]